MTARRHGEPWAERLTNHRLVRHPGTGEHDVDQLTFLGVHVRPALNKLVGKKHQEFSYIVKLLSCL